MHGYWEIVLWQLVSQLSLSTESSKHHSKSYCDLWLLFIDWWNHSICTGDGLGCSASISWCWSDRAYHSCDSLVWWWALADWHWHLVYYWHCFAFPSWYPHDIYYPFGWLKAYVYDFGLFVETIVVCQAGLRRLDLLEPKYAFAVRLFLVLTAWKSTFFKFMFPTVVFDWAWFVWIGRLILTCAMMKGIWNCADWSDQAIGFLNCCNVFWIVSWIACWKYWARFYIEILIKFCINTLCWANMQIVWYVRSAGCVALTISASCVACSYRIEN